MIGLSYWLVGYSFPQPNATLFYIRFESFRPPAGDDSFLLPEANILASATLANIYSIRRK